MKLDLVLDVLARDNYFVTMIQLTPKIFTFSFFPTIERSLPHLERLHHAHCPRADDLLFVSLSLLRWQRLVPQIYRE
jgi:hypothetical protein